MFVCFFLSFTALCYSSCVASELKRLFAPPPRGIYLPFKTFRNFRWGEGCRRHGWTLSVFKQSGFWFGGDLEASVVLTCVLWHQRNPGQHSKHDDRDPLSTAQSQTHGLSKDDSGEKQESEAPQANIKLRPVRVFYSTRKRPLSMEDIESNLIC